ncbi:sugar ABC transporter substrate-binding protein [Actinoplanes sp. NBRC 14428]|uniref:Carbohydrate ABC transporter substrate-binding protein (CUT1 family) n=1 Tax=Pseudosporangium ferrugineum TaxID=439699 RepID=A0A2T0SIE9_9ACTN|nr:sugar ABC transporter substrate-binding protein [Pseudosporangium ferrugineum]PRY33143.1 carbohydrate ABC transporter substrate-binding protein (CUT1 family) [Pseudosporangium ferrugineum]BCJ48873.1 sugar ABC transporter substrate-binding protein [Actinoplanes sp. NBRC 14428]
MRTYPRRRLLGAAALATALVLAGCGGSDDDSAPSSGAPVSEADVRAALQKGGNLTVWAWEPTLKQVVAKFQQAYPAVKVDLVNAGTGNDQYTAVQNAVAAGSGGPDVAQIEYYALPQFALGKSIAELGPYGAGALESTFTPGPWASVHSGKGVYGLPMDSGPMALFYNKQVFDKHGLKVPTTWAEYLDAARRLHKADPKAYIANDTGDAGFVTSLIWQAGGKPYQVDGTTVTITFADSGTQQFAAVWQQLISEKLLAPIVSWSDQWYQGLGNGTIATLATGAWMPANFTSGVPAASGRWRVAPLPQWQAGAKASAENGGSSLAIMEKSGNKALAYAFLRYATDGDGVQTRVDNGAFPATTAQLTSPAFLDSKFAYFGGQQANRIFAESARNVAGGWSYLPFQVYANSIFKDTVGQAYVSATPLADGLKAWQDRSAKYGKEQGFTVK